MLTGSEYWENAQGSTNPEIKRLLEEILKKAKLTLIDVRDKRSECEAICASESLF